MVDVVRVHDPNWRGLFETEAAAVRERLTPTVIRIHHVGSTAIPDMFAKPIIDILVEASALALVDARTPAMQAAGYDARGEFGIEGRRYFKRAWSEQTPVGYHVHVYEQGSPQIARHLRFRDYLLANPDKARAYSAFKLSLSDEQGVLCADYAARKAAFVREVEAAALTENMLLPD